MYTHVVTKAIRCKQHSLCDLLNKRDFGQLLYIYTLTNCFNSKSNFAKNAKGQYIMFHLKLESSPMNGSTISQQKYLSVVKIRVILWQRK